MRSARQFQLSRDPLVGCAATAILSRRDPKQDFRKVYSRFSVKILLNQRNLSIIRWRSQECLLSDILDIDDDPNVSFRDGTSTVWTVWDDASPTDDKANAVV